MERKIIFLVENTPELFCLKNERKFFLNIKILFFTCAAMLIMNLTSIRWKIKNHEKITKNLRNINND